MTTSPWRRMKHAISDVLQGPWRRGNADTTQAHGTAMNSSIHPSTSAQQSTAVSVAFPDHAAGGSGHPSIRTESLVAPSADAASGSVHSSLDTPSDEMNTSPRGTGWMMLKVLQVVRDGSDLFILLRTALVGVVEVMDEVDNVGEAQDEFERIAQDIDQLLQALSPYGMEQHASPLVRRRLKRIEEVLDRIRQEIENKARRNGMRRVFESWTDVREVESIFRELAAMIDDFQLECNLHTERMTEDLEMSRLKAQLQHIPDAGIDAQSGAECMQGTREALLGDLKAWSGDSAAPPIFWLNGMAGTGKSAIARSLCLILRRAGVFGGSFFCSRGTNRDDIKRIIPTLTVSLACQFPAYKRALSEALRKHPDAGHDRVEVQVERLLRGPLREAFGDVLPTLVLVIDALDECADQKATSTVLTHLLQVSPHMPIKFFVTSRPEQHIRAQFERGDLRIQRILRLHDIETSIVETDLALYIRHRLHEIRRSMAASEPSYSFPPQWPTDADIVTLACHAGKLFIYAFTATEYIQTVDPVGRLCRCIGLEITTGKPFYGPLDDVYTFILDKALDPKHYEAEELHTIRRILAAILTVREHLSLDILANLIGIPAQRIRVMLQALHAVVDVPPLDDVGVISTFHASFGDFMTTPERAGQFLIDRQTGHRDLADCCIRIMDSELLHFNVNECTTSYLPNDKQLCAALPKQLTYGCSYWSYHIVALEDASSQLQQLDFILSRKLLLWLEVISTLRQPNRASIMIMQVLTAHQSHMADDLSQFLRDANIFVVSCQDAIERSAPHMYLSALPSAHTSSRIADAFWPGFINVPVIMTMGISRRRIILQHIDNASPVMAVTSSPDGACIVSGSYDNTIRIWSVTTGRAMLKPLEGHSGWVKSVASSPDGTRIVSGSADNTIRIWDASTGQALLEPLKGHTYGVTYVVFSPDGTLIVSGSGDKTIRIWDANTGQALLKPLEGHTCGVCSIAFSPDGSRIVSGSYDKTIRIWDANTGQALLEPLKGHTSHVNSVAFSPDGTRIVSGSYDKTIRVWDAHTGHALLKPLEAHTNDVTSVAFSPDGSHIVSGSRDKTIRIWDMSTGQVLCDALEGHTCGVTSVIFSPNGTHIMSGSGDKTICIWDATMGWALRELLERHSGWVKSVALSLDGTRIVSGSADNSMCIWDASTGQALLEPLEGHTSHVNSIAFSPDGTRIVSGSYDKTIRIWDTNTGQVLLEPLEGHANGVSSVAFSPDGTRIVSGSYDKTICTWDVSTGQALLQLLQGHTESVSSVAFSPDGTRIVSGSHDNTVRIWDASTGQALLEPIQGHTNWVSSVAFSPDGTRIVSGSYDKIIRTWDASTGQALLEPLKGPTDIVSSITFSPDGNPHCVRLTRWGNLRVQGD
ncbi:hypothetical protein CERSUDRAFT_127336 [Gelatoporia subvermispora B]|uniref:NACHT domain-containing protein n=1 Tax=Ceriporiopsis subvermispora (strain B) TaxID=914234 RepID=M2P801_CERS8|nr:hypothetical protein CERSUDRAFT_127336 [Gelatoporia subvermispora B]